MQETWLEEDVNADDFQIPKFKLHLNSSGKGKGIAIYFKETIFKHDNDINEENMQLTKFTSTNISIIVLYRSQQGQLQILNDHIDSMRIPNKQELIIGDFNYCDLDKASNITKQYLENEGFFSVIQEPTHIEGNLLDQAYLKDARKILDCSSELYSKYYSDHKMLALIIKKRFEV